MPGPLKCKVIQVCSFENLPRHQVLFSNVLVINFVAGKFTFGNDIAYGGFENETPFCLHCSPSQHTLLPVLLLHWMHIQYYVLGRNFSLSMSMYASIDDVL